MHFSEIIKIQNGQKTPYVALYFTALWKNIIVAYLSLKTSG